LAPYPYHRVAADPGSPKARAPPSCVELGDEIDLADDVPVEFLELLGGHPEFLGLGRADLADGVTPGELGIHGEPRDVPRAVVPPDDGDAAGKSGPAAAGESEATVTPFKARVPAAKSESQ
jgi:hypothetical protein